MTNKLSAKLMLGKHIYIYIYIYILCLCVGITSIVLRFPQNETNNYVNSDATWHTLLTIEAYQETPPSIHKFLPIVTIGEKGIPWGLTVPDTYGNYYYTSFSPAGYVLPYAFMRICNLPINEQSLYIFNSLLYLLSFTLVMLLLLRLFDKKLPKPLIVAISALYLFQPEIMHGQGVVYWHQSLFQVIFLLQLLLFINLKGRLRLLLFFILCLIAPYVEWTGYLGNIGFALAFFMQRGNLLVNKKQITISTNALIKSLSTLIITVVSFALFCLHYLTVLDKRSFFKALFLRFFSRTGFSSAKSSLVQLLVGYINSFGILLILVLILSISLIIFKPVRRILVKTIPQFRIILFIAFFIMIENLLMLNHAVTYRYDQMKLIFPILIILTVCISSLYKFFISQKSHRIIHTIVCICIVFVSLMNLSSYVTDNTTFKWEAPYLKNNRDIVTSLESEYPIENTLYVQKTDARGYASLIFGHGIYDGVWTIEKAISIAKEENKRYIIMFQSVFAKCNMDDYRDFIIYDTLENKQIVTADKNEP
ncbi:MAG: hypothetical protein LBS74_06015 [Oscillospiraceae bacterium]|jgi:hypothetical protein|nr:hypothetical protein [Oscillospiraceae bacterium]